MKINIFLRQSITALLLMALPAVVQAQFTFATNNDTVTITGYNGPGGAVVIPGYANGYAVTGIGEFAFEDSTDVTSIVLSSNINAIGDGAFLGCASLTNISVNAGNTAFSNTNGVLFDEGQDAIIAYPEGITNAAYTIPASVRGIGSYAFASCSKLTSINIAAGQLFTTIGDFGFYGCAGLTNFGYIFDLGVTVSIGDYAFASCSNLTGLVIRGGPNVTIGDFAFSQCTSFTSIGGSNWIYANIGVGSFAFCSSLTNVVIGSPDIGDLAFAYCSSLTQVTVANVVTNIGDFAFEYCPGLTSITIANDVTNTSGFAFAFCTNLASAFFAGNAPLDVGNAFNGDPDAVVYYPLGTTGWSATFGGVPTVGQTPAPEFEYEIFDGSITIEQYGGPGGVVVIPAFINGYPVTSISSEGPNGTFPRTVTSVTIPNTVVSIGRSVFQDCFDLTNITIPDSVTSIGEGAFVHCTGLTSFTIPGGNTNIADDTFVSCSSLTNIVIPSSVTSIGYGAFDYCTSLNHVTIPDSVTSIGEDAFQVCTSLTSIAIPYSVTSIGQSAFEYCSRLASVTIANGVTSIGIGAFQECPSLTRITIPSSVTSIGTNALADDTNLTSAYILGNPPPDLGAFTGDPNIIVYYLPGTTGWGATFGGAPTELWNPQATALTTMSGTFGFNITGPTNTAIVVEACTNLANPVWVPVATNTLAGSGASSFSDPQWTNYPNRYYRFAAP